MQLSFGMLRNKERFSDLFLKKKSLLTIDMSSNSFILYLFIFVCLPCIFFARLLREYIIIINTYIAQQENDQVS